MSLLTNDMIFYVGTPEEATKKLHLDIISESSKIPGYKLMYQYKKLIAFLYSNNENWKLKCKKNIIYNHTKN